MRPRRTRGWWLAVAGAAVVLLAGCAQQSGARSGGGQGDSPQASSSAPPSTTVAPAQPSTSAAAGDTVVRGTVRQGVEAGCLLLDAQDKRVYLLLDVDQSKVRPGARVEVVGQRTDQTVSFCGEGVVLSVVSVRPLR